MKEVTYEDWLKNPTPRMMWAWDDDEYAWALRKVVFITSEDDYPVIAVTAGNKSVVLFKHCAEIEEPKTRRMTNKELARWLREKPTREYKYQTSDYIWSTFDYREYMQDEEVDVDMRIREDGGEWLEPLVEYEE